MVKHPMVKRSILGWERGVMISIVVLWSLLHFVFNWYGDLAPAGAIAAVNDSVW